MMVEALTSRREFSLDPRLRGDDDARFANAYLDGLDHFVQRQLGFGAYVRYMDDFVVCATDPAKLEAARGAITAWLAERRLLAVHGDFPLAVASQGVDFVGHIVRPAYALLRRRVIVAAHQRLWRAQAGLRPQSAVHGATTLLPGGLRLPGPAAVYPLRRRDIAMVRDAWASLRANLGHCAGRGLAARIWRAHPLAAFHLAMRRGKLRPRWAAGLGRPRGLPDRSLHDQLARLVGKRRDVVVLVQVGRHAELLRRQDWRTARVRPHKLGRSRFGAGMPVGHVGAAITAWLARGLSVLWIAETGDRAGHLAERAAATLVMPLPRALGAWQARAATHWPVVGRPKWALRSCAAISRHAYGRRRPRAHGGYTANARGQVAAAPVGSTASTPPAVAWPPLQLRLPFADWWDTPAQSLPSE